jgi:hypothetical protein
MLAKRSSSAVDAERAGAGTVATLGGGLYDGSMSANRSLPLGAGAGATGAEGFLLAPFASVGAAGAVLAAAALAGFESCAALAPFRVSTFFFVAALVSLTASVASASE